MSAQQHRERQRQRVDTLEDCLRQRDQEIAKLKGEVRVPSKGVCVVVDVVAIMVMMVVSVLAVVVVLMELVVTVVVVLVIWYMVLMFCSW